MVLTILLALIGVAATFYVFYRQKQKGKLIVKLVVTEEPFNPNSPEYSNWVFRNSKSDRDINVTIEVESHHDKPLEIGPYIIGVPKFQNLIWLSRIMPGLRIENIPLTKKRISTDLLPGEKTKELNKTGFDISHILKEKGFTGDITVMFGLFDENKNAYYSNPIQINIEDWEKDNGGFLLITV